MMRVARPAADLGRLFAPVRPDQPITSEIVEGLYGRRGALTWADLLERPRVVVLAEAGSGKTFEFERQVERLRATQKSAFFAPIEQLAETNLKGVLSLEDWQLFEAWQASGQPGWFFLDSVDEAKLTRRNFELGLKQFAGDLAGGFQRARIFLSCRGTDWDGEADLKRISTALPAAPPPTSATDGDEALLARFSRDAKSTARSDPPSPPHSVVSMTALSAEQRRRFLTGVQIADVDSFEKALVQHGLVGLANRPGDLLVLTEYWAAKGQLGGLTSMMDVSIDARIADRRDRPDAAVLSLGKARQGAERIAAAMVLGRALTVKLDPLVPGAGVSLAAMLPDWRLDEQQALIRRGVFAAETYGHARFNHRAVMEYLAARWFVRALENGCPASRVMAVMTARPFGVDTIPPSLRPVAAWLAPACAPLRRFIIEHAPLTLVLHGDPAVLSVADRAKLLRRYAELHRQGRIRHEYADEHALWMFADPALAPTIKTIWPDADDNFRFELLRLAEQGGLTACAGLAAATALDEHAGPYTRILAARVLAKFGRTAALRRLAHGMLAAPESFSARFGPDLATIMFPKAMSLRNLLVLMDRSPRARRYQVEGFGYVLGALYAGCPTPAQRRRFVAGVAALCRQPPLKAEWEPVSERHAPIARQIEDLLVAALRDVPVLGCWEGLVVLAWVAQAADLDTERDRQQEIRDAIRRHIALNEALFWFGVDRMVERAPAVDPVLAWGWQRVERRYWTIREEDRGWLEDAAAAGDRTRRRIAFAALIGLAEAAEAPAALADLSQQFGGDPQLAADLAAHLQPRSLPPEWLEHQERRSAREATRAEEQESLHQGWRKLRDSVTTDPKRLQDEALFLSWPGYRPLASLTAWLTSGGERDASKAVLGYSDLGAAFSPEVAESYRAAMLRFWRVAEPRPSRSRPGGLTTTPWSSVLAMAGLALEAATTPNWVDTLSQNDVRRAIGHAFVSGTDFPDWLDTLLTAYPHLVEPALVRELKRAWAKAQPAHTPLLYRAGTTLPMTPGVQRALARLIESANPAGAEPLDDMLRILRRLTLASAQRRTLARMMGRRLEASMAAKDWEGSMRLMPILFAVDPPAAADFLGILLDTQPAEDARERGEEAMGGLFGVSRGKVWGPGLLPEDVLADLLRLAYRYVRPEHDVEHEGSYTPDRRDDAEIGRNQLLGALMQKGGERAYLLMRRLLAEDAFGVRTPVLHRLANEMAELASEGRAWDEATVLCFEKEHTEPVTSGERLFALVCELIEDIARVLQAEDVSARELLLTAADEHAVQSWLASELQRLARGRFSVPIEKETLARGRLDITIVSSAACAEVAVELKHGDKRWTLAALRTAMSGQLAQRYLKSERRRHGVFVVSNHHGRRWADGVGGSIGFDDLIKVLQADAERLTTNRFGPIHVAARGIDAVLDSERTNVRRGKAARGRTTSVGSAGPTPKRDS